MKKLLTLLVLSAVICVFVAPVNGQVLWRSASTMKQGSYIAMTQFYYFSISQSWDYGDEKWVDYPHSKSEWGFNTMIGYAVTDRMECMVHIPFRNINFEPDGGEAVTASGIGDIWLKSRIAVFPWSKDKHGFAVTSTLSLPSGTMNKDLALGSGRIKYALGGIFSTAWLGKYRGHIKLNYWFDQKGSSKDYGDDMKLILKNDYNFSKKVMGFLTYIMTKSWKDRNADGTMAATSDQVRHIAQVGMVYKPKPGWFIRPKLAYTFAGEGSSKWDFKPMIDFWYIFSIK